MNIIWNTPAALSALSGGMLIGLAAGWMVLGLGRIAGISGFLAAVVDGAPDRRLRLSFLGGLVLAPLLYTVLGGALPHLAGANVPLLLLAGLLVGIGTRFACGCTSGHGVCGLSRLSPRSLAATLSFMAAGFATVYLLRHVLAPGA